MLRATIFVTLLLFLTSSNTQAGWFSKAKVNTPRYVDMYTLSRNNNGVDPADLNLTADDFQNMWNSVLRKNAENLRIMSQAFSDETFTLEMIAQLNYQAANIWAQYLDCFGSSANPARDAIIDYSGKRNCLKRNSKLAADLNLLKGNIKNLVATSKDTFDELTFDLTHSLESYLPYHPLFGQILVETLSYYHKQISDKAAGENEIYSYSEWQLQEFNDSCKNFGYYTSQKENRSRQPCPELIPNVLGYYHIKKLLLMGSTSCLSFGFWPNATYFLFLGDYEVSTELSAHPALRYQNDQLMQMRVDHLYDDANGSFKKFNPKSCWHGLQDIKTDVYQVYIDGNAGGSVNRGYLLELLFDYRNSYIKLLD